MIKLILCFAIAGKVLAAGGLDVEEVPAPQAEILWHLETGG